MTPELMKAFVEGNQRLVTRKESKRYPGLFVLKYTRRVFYDNLWTPELELCRGLIVDADYNVVVRPFTKIYNRGERGTDIGLNECVAVSKKINGFMAAMTYTSAHGLLVSTTGSLDSEFVDLATKHLTKYAKLAIDTRGVTFLFEICDKSDPHIIDEEEGAYLIGGQYVGYADYKVSYRLLDTYSRKYGVKCLSGTEAVFADIVNEVKLCQHEGYVIHSLVSGVSLKIKSPYYLVTKALARRNFETICAGNTKGIDEEFYDVVEYVKAYPGFGKLEEQEKIAVVREFLS